MRVFYPRRYGPFSQHCITCMVEDISEIAFGSPETYAGRSIP